jgi:drug/metabolite transporter (DMT)-like permease
MFKNSPHLLAVLQALFVTFLWSTSWVLIKFGLEDIPALTFAGMRYTLAFLCLLPFAARHLRSTLGNLPRRLWWQLIVLGLLYYTITQGTQFVGLAYLPALTVSLLLTSTVIVVALMGIVLLGEHPTALQWGGIALFLVGAGIYFYPLSVPAGQAIGYIAVIAGVLTNAGSAILGRQINREKALTPLTVTVISMGIGSVALLVTGVATEGVPQLSLTSWATIGWLAVVNTAIAFTLWNHTLRTLTAMESSVINNTMLVQIAILAWLFLGERIGWRAGIGMALAGVGALAAQVRRLKKGTESEN